MLSFQRINRNIRSIRRYRQILGILIKYGFGHVVEQLNIDYYLELGRRIVTLGTATKEIERLNQPQRLRLAMEELGPTFVKLGQVLSTRPDLIPQEYAAEFSKLQDKVPPEKTDSIREQIELELGQPVNELFVDFRDEPIAAASIGQVHLAQLKSGEKVVVKVLRPGISHTIETDLDILMGLAYLVENHLPEGLIIDPIAIVREFRRIVQRELDFTREAHTIDRFAANFEDDETVFIPKVHWQYSGTTTLTMDFVDGIKVSETERLKAEGYELPEIARNGADAFLRQVLEFGLFHGDPHPGNVFILPGNVICMLDYGMVGHLDDSLKYHLLDLIICVVERDTDRLISQLVYAGDISEETDRKQLKRDLSEFIDDYHEISLQNLNTGKLLTEFIEILQHHRIKFPADLILLGKALVAMEGVGRQLDPEFDMVAHLKPFIEQLIRKRLSPTNVSREAMRMGQSYLQLLKTLPGDVKEFVNRVNRNKFKIDLEHRGLEKLISDLDRSSNRLSFSLLIGAIIVGSSLVMQTEKGPLFFGFPILGLLGYTIAGLLGLWLAIAILRSGRL
ncbi:MAG: ubiquinone biosynthesis protein UbiB [Desulfuromonas sp.]|nr:MAG: ubiquinone biosynthesis protein UbiB [Desulfuromonas sp.]